MGLVEIWVDGKCILVIGRGNSVGERGALRGEARTATVVARGQAQLLSLDEETFTQVADRLQLNAAFARAEWLWRNPKFGHLPWATLLDLALDFEPRQYESGECLFEQGEVGHESFLLVSGAVHVIDQDGETKGIYREQGEFLGGRTALFSRLHQLNACAMEPTEAWALPASALQRLQMVYPNVILQLRAGDVD